MSGGQDLQLPPGFRFQQTIEELEMHYRCRRCIGLPIAVPIIAEIDLYKFAPWQFPRMALYGEKEWYFFPRDRKYPNGSRPNRAAGSGYWKATGADKPVGSPRPLVFYAGKAPKGEKTNWIMHEYRLADVDRSARKNSLRGHAPGFPSIIRAINTIPADVEEIEALNKQIAALKKKNKISEDYGREKKKECEEWKEKYEDEKKSRERLQNKLGRSCKRH